MSLGAARTEVAARLLDPSYVYWTIPELTQLIIEAIRTWQALTSYFKQRITFDVEAGGGIDGSAFWDLNFVVPELGQFVTDRELIERVLATLLEPPLTATWNGTGHFQFEQIVESLQNRINRWLTDTGANVHRHIQNVETGPTAARLFLPEGVLDVRRAAWKDSQNLNYTTLWRDDEYAMQAFRFPGSLAPAQQPLVWGKFTLPPVGIEVYPPPANPGQVETLVVESGPLVGASPQQVFHSPTVLLIPEDHVWGVIFGALSDLFNADGPMRDPERAIYSESRYEESVELYKLNPTLLMTRIDGVPVWTGSVFEMDSFMASWQAQPGQPQFVGMAGRNLVAFAPIPNQLYGITMDLVSNIPLPVRDTDLIQVDRGALAPLLDYVQHLACLKMAGYEFKATDKLRGNFLRAAALENSRLTRGNFYRTAMQLPALRQQQEVPRGPENLARENKATT